jgi:hypothetical protein
MSNEKFTPYVPDASIPLATPKSNLSGFFSKGTPAVAPQTPAKLPLSSSEPLITSLPKQQPDSFYVGSLEGFERLATSPLRGLYNR